MGPPLHFINLFAFLARDGNFKNINDVIISLKPLGNMMIVLGIGFLIIAAIVYHLNSKLNKRSPNINLFIESQYPLIWVEKADLLLLFIIGLFLFFCLPTLNQALWWDEAWTMRYVSSWKEIFVPNTVNNHLLNTILIKLMITIIGEKEWVIRLPALLSGCITITGIYYFIKNYYNSVLYSLLTAILAATSYGFIFLSINARGYSIIMAVSIWNTILLQNIVKSNGLTLRSFLLLLIINFLGIITIPTSAISLLALIAPFIWYSIYRNKYVITTLGLLMVTLSCAMMSVLAYNISLPIRILSMSYINNALGYNLFSFFWGKLGYWLSDGGFVLLTIFFICFIIIGFYSLLRKNKLLFTFNFTLMILSLLVHMKSGMNSFWYSSMGMMFVPILCCIGLIDIFIRYIRKINRAKYINIILLVMFLPGIYMNCNKSLSLWLPRSQIDILCESIITYARENQKIIGVILPTPPVEYYFSNHDIPYKGYSDIDDYQSSGIKHEIILSRANIDNSSEIDSNYNIEYFPGWADNYTLIYHQDTKKYFNKN